MAAVYEKDQHRADALISGSAVLCFDSMPQIWYNPCECTVFVLLCVFCVEITNCFLKPGPETDLDVALVLSWADERTHCRTELNLRKEQYTYIDKKPKTTRHNGLHAVTKIK